MTLYIVGDELHCVRRPFSAAFRTADRQLRTTKDIRTAPLLAASIFLDVLNVFFLFLSLFGGDE